MDALIDRGEYAALAYCTYLNQASLGLIPRSSVEASARFFSHAVAKETFSMLDYFTWRRVARMLMERHHWGWTEFRRRHTTPEGRWLPITGGQTELRRIDAIPVTRYRYRGSKIPSPWPLPEHA